MAGPFFVDSNGTYTDGLSFAGAFADLDIAFGTAAAGETIYVAHNHAASYGDTGLTYNNNGTVAEPINVICVNSTTGSLATTATESAGTTITSTEFENSVYCYGVTFSQGYFKFETDCHWVFEKGGLIGNYNNAIYVARLYYDDSNVELIDFDFKFPGTLGSIRMYAGNHFKWVGGQVNATTPPDYLFQTSGSSGSVIEVRDVDLSAVGEAIFETLSTSISLGLVRAKLIGCKLPSGKPVLQSSSFVLDHEVIVHSCDTGDGYWYFEETYLEGQIKQSTAYYLNATYDGSAGFSAQMVSNTNALDHVRPLRFKLCEVYADANPTLTVELTGAVLQNDEFWIEIEYPDADDKALRNIDDTSRVTYGWSGGNGPGTPANLETSSETWSTTDLTEQYIEETISGGAAGIHTVWACLAKPEITVYVDPDVTVS